MAKTPRASSRSRTSSRSRKPRTAGGGKPPNGGGGSGTPAPNPAPAPVAPVASGEMPSWMQKGLMLGTVGTIAYNKGKSEGIESSGGGWSAPATTPENTAINPDDVKANAKQEDKKPEDKPNSATPAGSPSTGSSTKTPVAETNSVGANAITPEEVKQNLEMDPNSSGKPWGERSGGAYRDATGRMVTDNPIARAQQAYLNQYGMPTARQRDMDLNAQLSDRNSPLYQAYDRMSGGSLTKQREWEADKERRAAPQKLLEGITPEQQKILAKFQATGEGPDPKYKMPEADYRTTPTQVAQPATTNPSGVVALNGVDPSQFTIGGGGGANLAPQGGTIATQVQNQASTESPVATSSETLTDSEGNPIAVMDENDPWVQAQIADAEAEQERLDSMNVNPQEDRAAQRQDLRDRSFTQASVDNLSSLSQFADEAWRVKSSAGAYGLGKTLLGKGNLSGFRDTLYAINPTRASYVPQFVANATPQPVANAVNSALGRNITKDATAAGAKALKNPSVGQIAKANKVNTFFAGLNAAGGLAAAYNEFTGDNYDPYALVGMGETKFGENSGQKGKRANAHQWAGKEGSRYIGAAEAMLNNLSVGGYDAMRANMWGGDDYIAQRGGVVDADPLGAGSLGESLGDRFWGWLDEVRNPKSNAVKAHEAQRRREFLARQVKANAGQPNT